MRKPFVALCALVFAVSLSAAPPQKPATTRAVPAARGTDSALAAALNSVSSERIRADVKLLSSDLFEGRGTGQRGGDLAAEYIATQFELAGLKPAGDNGSFLQKVPMVGIATDNNASRIELHPANGAATALKLRDDIVAMDESESAASDVDSDIVFVGYGITAPEFKWNDYKDVDVRGKVLLMLVNEPNSEDPKFFNSKALTYYGRWTYKFEEAARKGAVGALIIHKTEMASYGWNVVQTSWSGERSYLRGTNEPKLKLASWISGDVANKLAASINSNLDELIQKAQSREFKPVPLPVKLKAHIVSTVRPFDSANALAVLPGGDPKLKDEAVIYSAHWDHLGIRPGVAGDNIYNGAVDNASGCGVLIEMARAFASSPQKPKRSILFAAVTGEEQGLLGSEYLGLHPPIPAGRISLNLNFDGIPPIGIPEEIEVSGAERTTFYPVVEQTAKDFKLAMVPDSNPGAGHFYRSDHFSMARVGVPAFSVNQGEKFAGKDKAFGEKWQKEYTARDYHQPSDEFKADWDFGATAKIAQFGVALGWEAANQQTIIGWQPGDEFAAAREKSRAAMSAAGR